MKKFLQVVLISFLLTIINNDAQAVVKVFVNNTNKTISVKLYGNNNDITSVDLLPGAIQDVFVPSNELEKIIICMSKEKRTFHSINRQYLYKETSEINKKMIFIIEKNGKIHMYKGVTTRDQALQDMDTIFMKEKVLPKMQISIHTTKTNEPWVSQDVQYSLNFKKSLTKKVESIFS